MDGQMERNRNANGFWKPKKLDRNGGRKVVQTIDKNREIGKDSEQLNRKSKNISYSESETHLLELYGHYTHF